MYNRRLEETIRNDFTHPLHRRELTDQELIETQLHKRLIPYSEVQFSKLHSVRNVRDLLLEKRRERLSKLVPNDEILEEKFHSHSQHQTPRVEMTQKPLSKSMNVEQLSYSIRLAKLEEIDLKNGYKSFEDRMATPHLFPLNPSFYWGYRERDKQKSSKFLSSSWVSPTKLTNRKSLRNTPQENVYLECKPYDNDLPGDNMRNRMYSFKKDAYSFRDNFHFNKEKRLVNLPKEKQKLKNKVVYDHMIYNTKTENDRISGAIRENGGREYLLESTKQVIIQRKPNSSKWISDANFSHYVYPNAKRNPIARINVLHQESYQIK